MTNKLRNISLGVITLVFGILIVVFARDIPHRIASDVGSAYVPTFIGICVIAIAVAKLIVSVVKNDPSDNKKIEFNQDAIGGASTIALMFGYMIIFEKAGFILASALYLFLQMFVLSEKSNRRLPLFAAISILLPVAIDALFVFAIKMPLPKGIIGF